MNDWDGAIKALKLFGVCMFVIVGVFVSYLAYIVLVR